MTAHFTAGQSQGMPLPTAPAPDIRAMRAAAHQVLVPDCTELTADELGRLIRKLREHIELLALTVQELIRPLPADDIPGGCATYRVGEARLRLRAPEQFRHRDDAAYAQGLSRSLRSLSDHYEALRDRRAQVLDDDREVAAYLRMLYHPHGCRECLPADGTPGCQVAERLYEEWRQTRRGNGGRG